MIELVLPDGIVGVDCTHDIFCPGLLEGELDLIANAVDKRRREFATVRECARIALSELGIAPVPIYKDKHGSPMWPKGVVGSLTHCEGYRGAAVTLRSRFLSVGVDAEPHIPLRKGIIEDISVAIEITEIDFLAKAGLASDRLLYSAKESLYKAWYGATGDRLGFRDAIVLVKPDGSFEATEGGGREETRLFSRVRGKWIVVRDFILTSAVVPDEIVAYS